MMSAERICSLLPSATEIVCALGLGECLVGVTHECDFPSEVLAKPRVTSSVIDSEGLSSRAIDAAVRERLDQQSTIYQLDRDVLDYLRPDLILTQELCDVCAVGVDEVRAIAASLAVPPRVISLEPSSLAEVLDSIVLVGRLTGVLPRAIQIRDALADRLRTVRAATAGVHPVRALTLEWVDPVFVGGHWVPEMVRAAGGIDVLGVSGEPSRVVTWAEVRQTAPEVVIAMPCGFGLERSQEEMSSAVFPRDWWELPAVRDERVYVVDGSSYFNRPGPRLVDGVEILTRILHPEVWQKAPEGSFVPFRCRPPL